MTAPQGASGRRDADRAVYVISVAAELAGMHAQTLRQYDRLGLVTPGRSPGGGRRYSERDVDRLREVQELSQSHGVNLAGIKRIIELGNQVAALQDRVTELEAELGATRTEVARQVAAAHASHRRDLVPLDRTSLVIWKPAPRRGV